ncbi:tautomerase family protein [Falsiroseomonas oryzae]|uniref:tautomerase family protein n=1 Tax=Falsiroseomonas oryzae TaxID=2766473 RepID=UPI0022EB9808|nr:tautomerase family protein [Roseomonas sp. MO-31]
MPCTRISTGDWARGRERTLIDAVQASLEEAIRIPDWDRDILLDLYDEGRRLVPTGASERYTRIEITLYAGRSLDAKRALYRTLVERLAALGVPRRDVKVVLTEFGLENCAPPRHEGVAACDITDLGYRVTV